jgi:hypothetical protein
MSIRAARHGLARAHVRHGSSRHGTDRPWAHRAGPVQAPCRGDGPGTARGPFSCRAGPRKHEPEQSTVPARGSSYRIESTNLDIIYTDHVPKFKHNRTEGIHT